MHAWPHFYQTRSAWSVDQGSTRKCSAVRNFAPTVTKFCVMWEGLSLPHDTTFGNRRGEIADRRILFIWSLIHGSSWSGLIKVGPGEYILCHILISYRWVGLNLSMWYSGFTLASQLLCNYLLQKKLLDRTETEYLAVQHPLSFNQVLGLLCHSSRTKMNVIMESKYIRLIVNVLWWILETWFINITDII